MRTRGNPVNEGDVTSSQNPRRARMYLKWHACVRAGDSASRLRGTAGIKGQAGGSDTYTVGTSRHVAVALYTNSIMHARANINYYGFNIGRGPWAVADRLLSKIR